MEGGSYDDFRGCVDVGYQRSIWICPICFF
jgi:hypothetical protein